MTKLLRKQTALFSSLAIAALLSACDTAKFEELQTTEATAGAFSKALTQEYSAFAKSEIEQYDWPDQQYFAKKGLRAAKGAQPLPEEPRSWNIRDADQIELVNSRVDLIHWLNTDGRFKNPARSAKAQASFDCWVEQKEENWQENHIKSCRDGMALTLPEMTHVNFSFDRSTLDSTSLEQLRKVALNWRNNPSEFLILQGHTDQVGNKNYNYALSRRRAQAVKMSLLAFGMPEEQIHIELWGKMRPREELPDESNGNSNRRVEILKF